MMRPTTSFAGLLLAALLLAGCAPSGPSKADVQEILQSQLDPSTEVVRVETVDQLNAAEQGDVWLTDVKATLRFPQSLTDVAQGMQENGGAAESLSRLGLMLRFGKFEAGETRPYRTRLKLIEGKNGWMRAEPTSE
ncbi:MULTISPECIES: hypothetical protein [unclassified Guyparkeria]|uniref:hypothetical protein n=1 Tax=unclassified Guyparkeria TaxID=2626246 RepID=UPI0007337212|nr:MULTISPECIES: hypothetical protein [unclassified Guyparkeria]KTG16856.1 hypothetical protein AUR63_02030 [Guyparkeria sp. XI15]OAE85890.1 hypothetical protein AWR35_02030 [Guyparkeria sp. WRN-7]